jgi:excisionase family DNA binding protein
MKPAVRLVAWDYKEAFVGNECVKCSDSIIGDLLRREMKELIVEAVREALNSNPKEKTELITSDELAARLNVPVSWVYEQSRHEKIPTHRIGRYIRFDIREVLQYLADAATIDGRIRKAG